MLDIFDFDSSVKRVNKIFYTLILIETNSIYPHKYFRMEYYLKGRLRLRQ